MRWRGSLRGRKEGPQAEECRQPAPAGGAEGQLCPRAWSTAGHLDFSPVKGFTFWPPELSGNKSAVVIGYSNPGTIQDSRLGLGFSPDACSVPSLWASPVPWARRPAPPCTSLPGDPAALKGPGRSSTHLRARGASSRGRQAWEPRHHPTPARCLESLSSPERQCPPSLVANVEAPEHGPKALPAEKPHRGGRRPRTLPPPLTQERAPRRGASSPGPGPAGGSAAPGRGRSGAAGRACWGLAGSGEGSSFTGPPGSRRAQGQAAGGCSPSPGQGNANCSQAGALDRRPSWGPLGGPRHPCLPGFH